MNTTNTLNGVILASRDEVIEHAENTAVHLTEEERTTWNAKANASQLDTKADASTLTAHETNTTVHVSQEEKQKWNARTTKGVVAATQDGLDEHTENTAVHITEEERIAWNSAAAIPEASNTFTGDNTHTGTETFNGPVTFNPSPLVSGRDIATKAVASNESALIMGYFQMLDAANCFCSESIKSMHNATAYVAANLRAPASDEESAFYDTVWNQDDRHKYYQFRIDFAEGTAIHFGTSGRCPDGSWQAARPYMIGSQNNNWMKSLFCVVGKNYHANALPYMLLYQYKEQEVLYAEIMTANTYFKTFSVHCASYQYGTELKETIYSGISSCGYDTPSLYLSRTEIITRGSTKNSRLGGCRIFSSAPGRGKEVNYRVYVAPVYNHDTVLADACAQSVVTLVGNHGLTRSCAVTYGDGSLLPDFVSLPAAGGEVELSVSAYMPVGTKEAGRAHVQPLDSWVISSLEGLFVECNATANVTLTVAANETSEERKTWVLIGQSDSPAVVLKIIQEAANEQ